MRPFSIPAYFLRLIWDGVPLLIWVSLLGLGFWQLEARLRIAPELALPIAGLGVWSIMWILRPIRKWFNMTAYYLMVCSSIKWLEELGVWKLLLVNDRYWSSDMPLYEGMAAFSKAYRGHKTAIRKRICQILWRCDAVGRPHIAKPSREFLREVDAPLRDEVAGSSAN